MYMGAQWNAWIRRGNRKADAETRATSRCCAFVNTYKYKYMCANKNTIQINVICVIFWYGHVAEIQIYVHQVNTNIHGFVFCPPYSHPKSSPSSTSSCSFMTSPGWTPASPLSSSSSSSSSPASLLLSSPPEALGETPGELILPLCTPWRGKYEKRDLNAKQS